VTAKPPSGKNHGLLTVGAADAAAWWFITMERSCQAELMARAAGLTGLKDFRVLREVG